MSVNVLFSQDFDEAPLKLKRGEHYADGYIIGFASGSFTFSDDGSGIGGRAISIRTINLENPLDGSTVDLDPDQDDEMFRDIRDWLYAEYTDVASSQIEEYEAGQFATPEYEDAA